MFQNTIDNQIWTAKNARILEHRVSTKNIDIFLNLMVVVGDYCQY